MKKLLGILLVSATLFSCKDKDKAPELPSQTKENIAGLYKLTALTQSTMGSAETSVIDLYIKACEKDDLQQLRADFTFNYIDAGTTCTPAGDKTGVWALPATGKITINGQSGDIVSFNGTVLIVSRVETIGATNFTFKTTFTKQ